MGTPVPLADMPVITPTVETNGRLAPDGVLPFVGSDRGAATDASVVEIGESFRSSLK
jgi:hypothetical protein